MEKTCVIILFMLLSITSVSSEAKVFEGSSMERPSGLTCPIGFSERALILDQLDKLTKRLYYASLEAMDHPNQFLKVKSEVRLDILNLLKKNGLTCMIELGAPLRFL